MSSRRLANRRMPFIRIVLLLMLAGVWGCRPGVTEIFVSPDGNPSNTGTRKAPLQDIGAALRLAGQGAAQGNRPVIRLLPGTYRLSAPLQITPALSGLRIEGAGAGVTRIVGSVRLDPVWQVHEGQIFRASLSKGLIFDQLVADGGPQVLARYPNRDEAGGHWQGHAADAISPERTGKWRNPVGGIVHAMHAAEWGDFHYVIDGMEADGSVRLRGGHQNNRPAPMHPRYRMVENVLEELDSPGEWYLDTAAAVLYYWPPAGIDLSGSVFEAVTASALIEIRGEAERPVRDVVIRGISFGHTRRKFMDAYEPLLRSDWTIHRGAALLLEGAEDCTVQDCEFAYLGGNAIFASGFNRGVRITGNHIHDCGASGICFVGHPSAVRSPAFQYSEFVPVSGMDTLPGPKSELFPRDCAAEDNLIYRTGRIEKQTAGIQIAMAMGIALRHNSIYEVPRAGINVGDGTWGGHIIEFNDVFETVLETGDHGSFNSWGRDRFWHPDRRVMDSLVAVRPDMPAWDATHTTVIRNNRFRCDYGWDIDLDDGSSNYHIYNNLCLQGGIKLREGFNRTVENNILVNNGFHPHVWFRNSGDVFRRNIAALPHADILLGAWGREVDYNLYATEQALQQVREKGVDLHSAAGDPLFRDPASGDFSVTDASPALELGFVNFPMDRFGVQRAELKAIARTPEIPELIFHRPEAAGNAAFNWLGMRIKTIETLGERSAAGLDSAAGVLILEIPEGDHDSGVLRRGDVILAAEGVPVGTVQDLLVAYQQFKWQGRLRLLVHRNQARITVTQRLR
jgi:hypothetical protein